MYVNVSMCGGRIRGGEGETKREKEEGMIVLSIEVCWGSVSLGIDSCM